MHRSSGYLAGGKSQLNRAGRVKSPIIHVCREINSRARAPGLMRLPLRAGRGWSRLGGVLPVGTRPRCICGCRVFASIIHHLQRLIILPTAALPRSWQDTLLRLDKPARKLLIYHPRAVDCWRVEELYLSVSEQHRSPPFLWSVVMVISPHSRAVEGDFIVSWLEMMLERHVRRLSWYLECIHMRFQYIYLGIFVLKLK